MVRIEDFYQKMVGSVKLAKRQGEWAEMVVTLYIYFFIDRKKRKRDSTNNSTNI